MLRSPIEGIVRERLVFAGEYRAAGTPIVTIVRQHPLRLQLAVPERAATTLRAGQRVRVTVEGDTTAHEGRVSRVSPSIAEGTRTLPIEAEIPNVDGKLRPGTFAKADIVTSEDPGIHRFRSRRWWCSPASKRSWWSKTARPRTARPHRRARRRPRRADRRGVSRATWSSSHPAGWLTARRSPSPNKPCVNSPLICIQRPVFATMLIMALVVIGARVVHAARRGPLPVRRPAERHGPHHAAWRLGRRSREPDLGRARRSRQPCRRHQRAALGVGARPVDVERHVQPQSRHRHRRAGRARSRRRGDSPAARGHRSRR